LVSVAMAAELVSRVAADVEVVVEPGHLVGVCSAARPFTRPDGAKPPGSHAST
jgi:hypothetical protein